MSMIKLLRQLGKVKISLDFMEGEIRGRDQDDIIKLDKKFFSNTREVEVKIGETAFKMYVPSYADFLVLKLVSARPSDVRDIATLFWKNKLPKNLKTRLRDLVGNPGLAGRKVKAVIAEISHENFVNSWRGTFVSTEFGEKEKKGVLKTMKGLQT